MFLDRTILPEGAKVGFTCSTFDLFHAGHIVMLQEAKSMCDYLIVGLYFCAFSLGPFLFAKLPCLHPQHQMEMVARTVQVQ